MKLVNRAKEIWRGVVESERSSPDFVMNGKRAFRVFGVLLLVLGANLFVSGMLATSVGTQAHSRYEKASGRLARLFSDQDEEYYHKVSGLIVFGRALQALGIVVLIGGIPLAFLPGKLNLVVISRGRTGHGPDRQSF